MKQSEGWQGAGREAWKSPGEGEVRLDELDTLAELPTVPLAVPVGQNNGQGLRRYIPRLKPLTSFFDTSRGLKILIIVLILFAIVSLAVGGGINAITQGQQMRLYAHDGLQHLEDIRALVNFSHLDQALNSTTLDKVQQDLSAAEQDFGTLRRMLADPQGTFAVADHLPWTGSILTSARYLAAAADEMCFAGYAFVQNAQELLKILQGGLFAGAKPPSAAQPILNMSTYTQLRAEIATGVQHLRAAIGYAQRADLSVLPSTILKPQQATEVRQLLAKWPQINTIIGQANTAIAVVPALLGLNSPSKYLLELMDSTELRPGGGFIGNYAILSVVNGKIEPVTVSDTYLLDYPYLQRVGYVSPVPKQYSWWPFGTVYGLRDSNLSGNFPTSAQLAMQQLTREGGHPVQGVIAITPQAIEGIIHILGPIPMPQYGQVVTDTNLEHLIHLYELVPSEQPLTPLPPSEQISSTTKRFTALLGQALLQKLHGLSLAEQIAVGKQLLASMHSKDMQVFLDNSQAEGLLVTNHTAGTFPAAQDDGVTIVDTNVTGNKGSQFVTVAESDAVTLDNNGTATHHLILTYHFKVTNPAELYGPDYYLTYLRIYTPADAQLVSPHGFTNQSGDDQIGHSDQPGYDMWGGYLTIQDGTPYTLSITWKVPHAAVRDAKGRFSYTVDYTRQAGLQQALSTVIGVPGLSRPAYQFTGNLDSDKIATVTYSAASAK